jgi:hypothetical protein
LAEGLIDVGIQGGREHTEARIKTKCA